MTKRIKPADAISGSGPVVTATALDRNISLQYETFELQPLKPNFYPYPQGILETVLPLPDPEAAEASAPEVVAFLYELPNPEPSVAFDAYIRGVACAANMLPQVMHEGVREALLQVAERLSVGGDLPPLSQDFESQVRDSEKAILFNQEPMTFKGLLAFMQGAYWLLGFVKDPSKRRGNLSPLEFVSRMVNHWAQLTMLPQ